MTDRKRLQAGFTLIEVLAVVFILGLAAGFIVLTQPAPDARADVAAERVVARLRAAAREAVIAGEPIGVAFERDRLEFFRYRQGVWRPARPASAPLPARSALSLTQAGAQRDNRGASRSGGGAPAGGGLRDAEIPSPDIVFFPTGEASDFSAWIEHAGVRLRIKGDAAGRITVSEAR